MSGIYFITGAYNAESTIRRAIESILGQTHGDFMYYCLDNGSKDATGDIIQEYAKKDKRVIPLRHEINCMGRMYNAENRSLVSPMFHDQNGFFAFLDADDEYHQDFLKTTLSFANENALDMVLSGTEYISPDGSSCVDAPAETLVLEGEQLVHRLPEYYNYAVYVWSALISTRLQPALNFPAQMENAANLQDAKSMLQMLSFSRRVGVLPESLHKYYVTSGSLSFAYTPNWFWWVNEIQQNLRMFILSAGPMSKQNEDFLNKRFFTGLEFMLKRLRMANVSTATRALDMIDVFDDERTRTLLALNWKNIGITVEKHAFLQENLSWASAQTDDDSAHNLIRQLVDMLENLLREY